VSSCRDPGPCDDRRVPAPKSLPAALWRDLPAYVALAIVLTAIQASMYGLWSASWLLSLAAFNLAVSIAIGSLIELGHRLVLVRLGLAQRPVLVRLAAYAVVAGVAVLVGVELAVRVAAAISDSVAGVVPRAGVLRVAVPVTIVMVAIGRERERMRRSAAEADLRAERLQRQALRAELEALQSRVHPHFLFNALNTIAALIGEDPPRAEAAVERLATLLRHALEGGRRPWVTLRDELVVVRAYVEIEQLRFGERLRFEARVAPELEGMAVPPMILQPLVENVVQHAVAARREPTHVALWARRDGDALELGVEDDGPGTSQHRGTGTALADLRARLELAYAGRAGLEAGPAAAGGYCVRPRLPEVAA
jgi:sensor histidine kinase YesM